MDISIPHNWQPRLYQIPAWNYLVNGGKRAAVLAHRRWGKDDLALHWTAVSAMEKAATYWHMLPQAAQARKAIWEAINPHTGVRRIDEAFPHAIRETTREQEMMIKFINGSTWQVVGSDNYNSLIGSPPYGVVYSEWSVADPSSWAYLRPILAENGGWALFIYTARGKNHGYSLFNSANSSDEWFSMRSTVSDTNVFSKEVLERELKEYQDQYGEDAGRAYFLQEYHCSFDAAIPGAYYMAQLSKANQDGRVTSVPYDDYHPVHTWWDIGNSDYTSIWFAQYVGREIRLIDYYQANGQPPAHYVKMLREKGYNYDTHHLPHDANYKLFAAGGKSALMQLQDLWPTADFMAHNVTKSIQSDINVTRMFMSRCVWDKVKCQQGLEALGSYTKRWDDKHKIFSDKPLHNWASHGCFAAGTKVETLVGLKPIEDIVVGDEVLTPMGYNRVLASGATKVADKLIEFQLDNGEVLRCTPEHKFLTERGVVLADALGYNDIILNPESKRWKVILLYTKVGNMCFREAITAHISGVRGVLVYIGLFGSLITDLYLRVCTSITRITTLGITTLATLRFCLQANTPSCMVRPTSGLEVLPIEGSSWRHRRGQRSGIDQKPVGSGTLGTLKRLGRIGSFLKNSVRCAAPRIKPPTQRARNIATKIVRLRHLDVDELVYDLTVEKHHCYYANGALVSNSDAFRYLAVGYAEESDIAPSHDSSGVMTFAGAMRANRDRGNFGGRI